jgi:hypothetical protein
MQTATAQKAILQPASKKELLEELQVKNRIMVEGINFESNIFRHLDVGGEVVERVNILFAEDKHAHRDIEFPACFLSPQGRFRVPIRWDRNSPLTLKYEDGIYVLYDNGQVKFEDILFIRRPSYYNLETSDGTKMRTVAVDYGYGAMFVAYSNECSLKDKGMDCLFCNINATKAIYGEAQSITWKTPKQVAETVAVGYQNGFKHVTISGGFVPERREVEYYIDVAEAIREETGLEDFNGTACVGAPADLAVFEKYKEAGFRTVATNMEIWNEKMFDVICPGKAQQCGGRRNWIDALDHEVQIFGKNKVRSTFVSGIEPKESLLEGIETLVSKGVLACASQWNVNIGSPLEGHRTPNEDWHWDVFEKTVAIYRKYGVTFEELFDANAAVDTVPFDLFRVLEDIEF